MKNYKKTIKKLENNKNFRLKFLAKLVDKINSSSENPVFMSRLLDIYLHLRPVSITALMLKGWAFERIEELKKEKRKKLQTNKVVNFNDYKN